MLADALSYLRRRPLLFALVGLISGIAAASANGAFVVTPAALWVAVPLYLLAFGQRTPPVLRAALLPLAFFFLVGAMQARGVMTPTDADTFHQIVPSELRPKPVWVRGVVVSDVETTRRGGRTFTMQAERMMHVGDAEGARIAGGKLRVTITHEARGESIVFGDPIWVRGMLEQPTPATNPGGFDYRAYLRRRGIHTTMRARFSSDVRRIPGLPNDAPIWNKTAIALRARVRQIVAEHLPPRHDAALLTALLIGDARALDAQTSDAFTRTGALHLLCVSGAHLVLVSWLLNLLTRRFLTQKAANVVALPLLWLYALMAGGGPAVLRAAFMVSLYLLAPLVGRTAHRGSALLFAAFVILLFDPLALYDVGTRLSFAVVAVLHLWLPALEQVVVGWEPGITPLRQVLRFTICLFLVGIVAMAAGAPLIAFHFQMFSPVAVVANVPLSVLSSLLLVGGLGTALASAVLPDWATGVLWAVLGFGLQCFRSATILFGNAPYAAVSTPAPPVALLWGYYALLGLLGTGFRRAVLRRALFAPESSASPPPPSANVAVVHRPAVASSA